MQKCSVINPVFSWALATCPTLKLSWDTTLIVTNKELALFNHYVQHLDLWEFEFLYLKKYIYLIFGSFRVVYHHNFFYVKLVIESGHLNTETVMLK